MNTSIRRFVALLLGITISSIGASPSFARAISRAATGSKTAPDRTALSTDQVIDRLIEREHEEVDIISRYRPIIETYGQDSKVKHDEAVPWRDWYLLGVANTDGKLAVKSLLSAKDQPPIRGLQTWGYLPQGFLQEIYLDRNGFDRKNYQFHFAGREFLGEVRCLAFDVTPLPGTGHGRFKGRIWVEDEDFTIVRFSGAFYPVVQRHRYFLFFPDSISNAYFDSWRANVQPGLWLPAYIFSRQTIHGSLIQAQTRLWGYDRQKVHRQDEYVDLSIQAPTAIVNAADTSKNDRSPLQAERKWRGEAETNALDTLQSAGLLAPPGPVDKVLNTVVNNLEVSNNLDVEPEIQCRILTTSNLEIFSIGHTIILSRGLIDVLPDEPTLAAVLAQAMGRVMTGKSQTDRYGFGDVLQVSAADVMRKFRDRENKQQVQAANGYGLSLLRNSPYKDKIGSAGLFLKQLNAQSKTLTHLINPSLGNGVYLASDLMSASPALQPERLDQIAALPVGGRLKLDPWDDGISFLDSQTVQVSSPREKMPFEVTPFMPFLTRYKEPQTTADLRNDAGH